MATGNRAVGRRSVGAVVMTRWQPVSGQVAA
jgi:hypothetical protein